MPKVKITKKIVQELVYSQFPQWEKLDISQILPGGYDNYIFLLGNEKIVRLPSAKEYEAQVEKEQFWLPKIQQLLPIPIPRPLGKGNPSPHFPFKWSIYQKIPGETASCCSLANKTSLAKELAHFLRALQKIDTANGPLPGPHNFFRGGPLKTYDSQVMESLRKLKNINKGLALKIWQSALKTFWQKEPVWIHGDLSAGNILLENQHLAGIIDFGMMAIGDPACDLVLAWTYFDHKSREIFKQTLELDEETWLRGKAWALWKALILQAKLVQSNQLEMTQSKSTLNEILC